LWREWHDGGTAVAGSSSAGAPRNGDHSDRADVRFARANIQIYDARMVDLYQWVCARYLVGVKGAETKAKRSQARLSTEFQKGLRWLSKPCPAQKQSGGQPSKYDNLLYISIGYGGESVSQLPLKDKAFFDLAGPNPPFELPSKSEVNRARASAIYPL
jgi:hypothetical protein